VTQESRRDLNERTFKIFGVIGEAISEHNGCEYGNYKFAGDFEFA
jgi:hypothetical protein